AGKTPGRFWRRASDAGPHHRARAAEDDVFHLGRYRRRCDRTGNEGQRGSANADPPPPAQPQLHAARFRRLAHASRCAGGARQRQGARSVLGRLAAPDQGIRPAAAGVMRAARTKTEANRRLVMKPNVVSAQQWQAAWQQMLVKEKELTRARDALAAERRRMP